MTTVGLTGLLKSFNVCLFMFNSMPAPVAIFMAVNVYYMKVLQCIFAKIKMFLLNKIICLQKYNTHNPINMLDS